MGNKPTDIARKRYDLFAPLYDALEGLIERRIIAWRKLLWSKIEGSSVLEVGVGTGRNFPFYPPGVQVTAVDIAENMLKRSRKKAEKQAVKVKLELMDVQDLHFQDSSFDSVVASLVFCSVTDPVQGLKEVKRVCKPGGKVVLLEHVLSRNRVAAFFMNMFNPLTSAMDSENINRRTEENVAKSGLLVESVTRLAGIVVLIEARKQRA